MIQWIHANDLGNIIYYAFHVLGFAAVFAFNLWYAPKQGIKKKQAIWTTVVVYSITYIWIYVLCWAETGFQRFGGNNIVRGFVYIPLIAWPVAKFYKIKWKRMCDFIAPCVCLCHGVSHMGCIFVGCCRGYASSFGFWNPTYETITFPVQPLEAITALVIVWILMADAKKKNYKTKGLSFPLMLVLFGSTRFLWEFARDNEKILWGCSSLAFHALFMAVVGAVMLAVLIRQDKIKQEKKKQQKNTGNRRKKK